jgi:hypothetical protein
MTEDCECPAEAGSGACELRQGPEAAHARLAANEGSAWTCSRSRPSSPFR